jgi:hypothetical protein
LKVDGWGGPGAVRIAERWIFRLPVVFRYTSVVKKVAHPVTSESVRGSIAGGTVG